MDEACRRLETAGHPDAAILSTDADSQVAPNWIALNQEELAAGAQAVAGRIVIPTYERGLLDPTTCELSRYDHVYRRLVCWIEDRFDPEPHDRWPRHYQHFGASLAVTPQAYKGVGRLPPRRSLEDVAFYNALIRHDVRLRHSNKVRVFTSARLDGRTRAGLSTQLSDWKERGKNALRAPVESGAFLKYLFAARFNVRLLWVNYRVHHELPAGALREVSVSTGIKTSHLTTELRAARYFGTLLEKLRFYEMCRKTWPDWTRLAPLRYATEELIELFSSTRRQDNAMRTSRDDIRKYAMSK